MEEVKKAPQRLRVSVDSTLIRDGTGEMQSSRHYSLSVTLWEIKDFLLPIEILRSVKGLWHPFSLDLVTNMSQGFAGMGGMIERMTGGVLEGAIAIYEVEMGRSLELG